MLTFGWRAAGSGFPILIRIDRSNSPSDHKCCADQMSLYYDMHNTVYGCLSLLDDGRPQTISVTEYVRDLGLMCANVFECMPRIRIYDE